MIQGAGNGFLEKKYADMAYDGDPMPEILWQSRKVSEKDTDMLHAIMSAPFVDGGHVYDVCNYGQFRCLNMENGNRVWETMDFTTADGQEIRWADAFIVRNEDQYFLFNELGDLIIAQLSEDEYDQENGSRRVRANAPKL